METRPVNLAAALDSFDEVYDPRILASVNDYTVRIAHTLGEHVWHSHDETDEFFLVLRGRFSVALRSPDGSERTVDLREGDVFVVPRGWSTSRRRRAARSSCSSRRAR
jgi:mannose-6-phosphate isomerase-like protein (cupin superfamily)